MPKPRNKMVQKNVVVLVLLGLLAGFLIYWLEGNLNHRPQEGQKIERSHDTADEKPRRAAPEFSFIDINDNPRSISDFRGKIILLNFWASWCAPCIKELPLIERIARDYTDRIVVLALSSDVNEEAMRRFLQNRQASMLGHDNIIFAHDNNMAITQDVFQTLRLPETYILDESGNIRHKFVGADWTYSDMVQIIAEINQP